MKKNELNLWLENTANGLSNQRVLFLKANQNDYLKILDDLNKQCQVTPIKIEDLQKYKTVASGMNPIIISDGFYKNIESMKVFLPREIIYIKEPNSIEKLILLINSKSHDFENEIYYELLQKIDFESLFKNEQINIQKFVVDRLDFLEKINSKFEDIDANFLLTCLKNYHEKKIVLASFAQLLYRLANLDFTSTSKKVGGNIKEVLGVKSSSISRSKLVDLKTNQLNKGFRVYNLNENSFIVDTKIKIAKNLVKLDIKELDITKISKATELPLKKVEKMYQEVHLN